MEISRESALQMLQDKDAIENHLAVEERARTLEEKSQDAQLKALERRAIIGMREKWSEWILYCIIGIVIFDMLIITALGFHWISFQDSWAVPVFVADGLIKIIGLAYVVVKFLFNKDSIG